MTAVTLLNSSFEKTGDHKVSFDLSVESINENLVHQAVKKSLADRRQGTACTKTRGLVSGGGAKPFKQKGTGRARQGSTRSSLMVGGGTAFGPTPRSYAQKMPKKMVLGAIRSIIADRHQAGKFYVVDKINTDGKTKGFSDSLESKGFKSAFIVTKDNLNAVLAGKNIPGVTSYDVSHFSVYEAVKRENLIIEKEALSVLETRIKGIKKVSRG